MAINQEGSKTYANITDLPIINDVRSGDQFIIQTKTGTSLLDFNSLIITLDNTSFKSTFNAMYEAYVASSTQINKIGSEIINVTLLPSDKQNLSLAVNQLNINNNAYFNELARSTNTIIDIINLNPQVFPNLPSGVTLPLSKISPKS